MAKRRTKTRAQKIVAEVVQRWANTINSAAPPDVDKARMLLKTVKPKHKVFVVNTPFEFFVAQAILRGRMSKKDAIEKLNTLPGISADFIKPLQRIGGAVPMLAPDYHWIRQNNTNMLLAVFEQISEYLFTAAETPEEVAGNRIRALIEERRVRWPETTASIQTQNFDFLYRNFSRDSFISPEIASVVKDWRINLNSRRHNRGYAYLTLYDAVSKTPGLLSASDPGAALVEKFDGVQAEILTRLLNCHKNPHITWLYEIFHLVPAIMQFRDGFLLLGAKPQIAKTPQHELHNESGPAVLWPDGLKLWAVNGHMLSQTYGEKIVTRPHELTLADIQNIDNEEERRVAIERMGWEKYLVAIKAKVADKRENWVDNTHEVLVTMPDVHGWGDNLPELLRMVLSCRSTGRKYFIAVPEDEESYKFTKSAVQFIQQLVAADPPPKSNDERLAQLSRQNVGVAAIRAKNQCKISTCDDAQNWMANGATSDYLDYAKHPVRVIGAS